jgi:hypothetical protein
MPDVATRACACPYMRWVWHETLVGVLASAVVQQSCGRVGICSGATILWACWHLQWCNELIPHEYASSCACG